MARSDQRDILPRIAVPTLLIWGELDVRSSLSVAQQFKQAIPDAQLVVIPDCGHLSHIEQPTLQPGRAGVLPHAPTASTLRSRARSVAEPSSGRVKCPYARSVQAAPHQRVGCHGPR